MQSFAIFLKQLRKQGNLTQSDLANSLGVSTVLISMIESEQKKASVKLLKTLAKKLKIHPFVLAPFAFSDINSSEHNLSSLEKELLKIGSKLQQKIALDRAELLK